LEKVVYVEVEKLSSVIFIRRSEIFQSFAGCKTDESCAICVISYKTSGCDSSGYDEVDLPTIFKNKQRVVSTVKIKNN
jgi:hypothetical protein